MIFTVEQVRAIRQGKLRAALVPVSERLRVMSVRQLRYTAQPAEDGTPPPRAIVTATERRRDGEQFALQLTVLALEDVELGAVRLSQAKRCGFRTTTELRESWTAEHPRAPLLRIVEFELGDLRDVPRLVSSGWPDYTSDPSRAMFNEPEALSRAQLVDLSASGWQRHFARGAQTAAAIARNPASQRLEAIENGTVIRPDGETVDQ